LEDAGGVGFFHIPPAPDDGYLSIKKPKYHHTTKAVSICLVSSSPAVRIRVLLSQSRLTEWLMVGDEGAAITLESVCHKGAICGFVRTPMIS
jgi:hypothetical protein